MLTKGEQYEIEITDLGSGGEGIGRTEGIAIFVPAAIPGDRILAEVQQDKKTYAIGKLVEILTPSPDRVTPPCAYDRDCGGCSLQSISYQGQLALKKKWVIDRLTRIGKLENPKVLDVIPMKNPNRYRNKAQFVVARVGGEEKKERGSTVGFYREKTHDAINIDRCDIQVEPANRIAEAVREYIREFKVPIYDPNTGTGLLRNLIVKTAFGTGEIMVILVATNDKIPQAEWLAERIETELDKLERYSLESLILNVNRTKHGETMGTQCITLGGSPTILDKQMGKDFEISPLSFYQVNPVQAEKLYRKVIEYAALTGEETVFDLYCGVGSIGIHLSDKAKRVIGIESQRKAVADANRNATINGCVNAEFIKGKVEEELPTLVGQGVQADVVVLDPPRAGCDPTVLAAVAEAGPSRIVYVSCDPATLARDIKILGGYGYKFVEAQPVDMFPQTGHVECVALMSRVEK